MTRPQSRRSPWRPNEGPALRFRRSFARACAAPKCEECLESDYVPGVRGGLAKAQS